MRKPNEKLSHYILKITGRGLLITAASLIAPQLPYLLIKEYIKHKFKENYKTTQVGNSFRYLKRKRFIAFKRKNNKGHWILTKLGRKHLLQINLSDITIPSSKWDGRWRLLSFDIPESHQAQRQMFRRKLIELGFFHFQRSVFILPYECQREIDQITNNLTIRPFVHILTADRFDSDSGLIKKFRL